MIRVSMVQDVEIINVEDKNGVMRQLRIFVKDDNMYIGPVQALFDRTYVLKDRHRMNFNSKLDKHQNELPHISFILDKIENFPEYSYFDKETMIKLAVERNIQDLNVKKKIYTACEELFIEYGFNSMNFCLDRRGDIWVHYKQYEEQKQRKSILKVINDDKLLEEFEALYRKCFRFIRYVNIDKNTNEIKCFALKSLNITKLYIWLADHMIIYKVDYVSDVYNETLRELEFHKPEEGEDMCYKIYSDKNGFKLKESGIREECI